jgi:hypothetical protein
MEISLLKGLHGIKWVKTHCSTFYLRSSQTKYCERILIIFDLQHDFAKFYHFLITIIYYLLLLL